MRVQGNVMWRKDENREVLRVACCALLVLTISTPLWLGFSGRPEEHSPEISLANSFPSTSDISKSSQRKKPEGFFQENCWDFCRDFGFLFWVFWSFVPNGFESEPISVFFGIHGEGPIVPSCCVGDGRETSPQNAISVEEFARCFGHFCGNVRVAPRCDESVKVEWVGPVDSHGFFKREIFW